MKITEIIEILNTNKGYIGIQLTKRKGLLNSTWLLYKKREKFYFFDINDKIEFSKNYSYSEDELNSEFEKSFFGIDLFIN